MEAPNVSTGVGNAAEEKEETKKEEEKEEEVVGREFSEKPLSPVLIAAHWWGIELENPH